MKRKVKSMLIIAISVLTFSCSTSNDVAGKFGIQKRKYTKGFSISKFKKISKSNSNDNQEILVENSTPKTNTIQEAKTKEVKHNSTSNVVNNTLEKENLSTLKPVLVQTKKNKVITLKDNYKSKEVKQIIKKKVKNTIATIKSTSSDDEILYYILAFLIPFLAVGLVTDWDLGQVLLNVFLTMLCGIPGIIHAIIVVKNNV